MKITFKILINSIFLFFCITNAEAQNMANAVANSNMVSQPMPIDSIDLPSFGTVDINLGTSGIGVELKKKVAEKVVLRFGYTHLPFSFTKIEQVGNVTINGYYKARFNNFHLFADYDLMTVKKTFIRGVFGLAYFSKANVDVHVTPVGKYMYGSIDLNDGHMGDANIISDWKGLAPYIGIGLGKAIPMTKMSFSFDFGSYYFLSAAKVDMVTSGYLAGNEVQRKQIQDNLKEYTWLPTAQISLNYKL